ncbi:scyllo-inositol 2-dehydrogenase (NAD+) [Desulfofundulus luciae]|uniref:Scyllo-inositol 2-dehydrogenase (NAD+) n=1 Tax=Desulfofundulus luciae TaxID=74702 RepID=A0ABU0AZT0_9FIRM|nr:inositol 2-dehydrogenase [Desulfofundulus luciae]MDQ0285971.1 scyllo-inositol 2-dehydrogenase (NAD+) [Desulfofundulus luciae]
MSKLACGVIGLGRLGFKHAETIAGRLANAKLVAVADPLKDNRERFLDRFNQVKAYADYHDLLNDRDVNAVIIATPTSTHARIVVEAMEAGKAVFCEKPLSLDIDEANWVVQETEKRGAFVQVGFMRRFDRGYVAAKEKLLSGEMGQPVFIHCIGRDPCAPPLEFARDSGGLFLDMCIHDIDLARWLMDSEVTRVYAQGGILMYPELKEIGDIDHANILVTFANGTLGSLEGSRNARYGYDVRTEIICTRGALFVGQLQHTPCLILNKAGVTHDVVPWFAQRFDQAYLDELSNFVQNVLENREPSITVQDGLMAVKIAVAVQKSFISGQAVTLDQV